jgi:hypothetical protein
LAGKFEDFFIDTTSALEFSSLYFLNSSASASASDVSVKQKILKFSSAQSVYSIVHGNCFAPFAPLQPK